MVEFNKMVSKYHIDMTTRFKSDYRHIRKQNKDLIKLAYVVYKIANGEELESHYMNHKLTDIKKYNDCYECHITSDWLLVYRIIDEDLVLLLFATGSYSELF